MSPKNDMSEQEYLMKKLMSQMPADNPITPDLAAIRARLEAYESAMNAVADTFAPGKAQQHVWARRDVLKAKEDVLRHAELDLRVLLALVDAQAAEIDDLHDQINRMAGLMLPPLDGDDDYTDIEPPPFSVPDDYDGPIHELTPDELRREIAERKGYTNVRMVVFPGQVRPRLAGDIPPNVTATIPDWPGDVAVALDLFDFTQEVYAAPPPAVPSPAVMLYAAKGSFHAALMSPHPDAEHEWVAIRGDLGPTPAMALCRLALAVLRAEAPDA